MRLTTGAHFRYRLEIALLEWANSITNTNIHRE